MLGHVPLGVQLHHDAPLYCVVGVHLLVLLLHPFPFTSHVIVNSLYVFLLCAYAVLPLLVEFNDLLH